jgi:L-seryl-tRNA(Ser) seleniumtransferase
MPKPSNASHSALRLIPSVDQLLRSESAKKLRDSIGSRQLTALARTTIADIRSGVRAGLEINGKPLQTYTAEMLMAEAERLLETASEREKGSGLRRVINATGVVLHTNLGRAALSEAALEAMRDASRYCTLEYDSFSGARGRRGVRVESQLMDLTGAEDALVVNNCASAALLILTVLAADGETLVSRGELVEIGGDFRIPDVMATSGTRLVEVGTTNRTHLDDYRRAINNDTRLIMRVHPSNYRIVGFATAPGLSELADVAHEAKLPLYEDAGSGQLTDLSSYGVTDEYTVRALIEGGADVISFSGDKLLGSAQAGLIVGKAAIVARLRKHPLYRALRSDKLRLAALEASLAAYQKDAAAVELPVIKMLSLTREEITERARRIIDEVKAEGNQGHLETTIIDEESAIGGGAGPTSALKTSVIALAHQQLSADELERRLRSNAPPIVGRISQDKVLLDLRTVFEDEEPLLIAALKSLSDSGIVREPHFPIG